MTATTAAFENLIDEISKRKRRLSLVLADLEDFQDLVDNFEKWLKTTEKTLESYKTLPLTSQEIKTVFTKFEVSLNSFSKHFLGIKRSYLLKIGAPKK